MRGQIPRRLRQSGIGGDRDGNPFVNADTLQYAAGKQGGLVLDVVAGDSAHPALDKACHALGLRHPFLAPALPAALDNTSYTVMSYTHSDFFTRTGLALEPSTPMDGDIYYLQLLYGANTSYHTGNDTYSFAVPTVMTIWDAGGVDTLSAANQSVVNPATGKCLDEYQWTTPRVDRRSLVRRR